MKFARNYINRDKCCKECKKGTHKFLMRERGRPKTLNQHALSKSVIIPRFTLAVHTNLRFSRKYVSLFFYVYVLIHQSFYPLRTVLLVLYISKIPYLPESRHLSHIEQYLKGRALSPASSLQPECQLFHLVSIIETIEDYYSSRMASKKIEEYYSSCRMASKSLKKMEDYYYNSCRMTSKSLKKII